MATLRRPEPFAAVAAAASVASRAAWRLPTPVRRRSTGPFMALLWMLAVALAALPQPGQAADIQRGAELYRLHCAACHGGDGQPLMPGATDFARPTSLLKPDLALLAVIRAGKGAMPAYQGQLRDRELLDIVAHLRARQY
ncbi:MAG: hypothetical protein RIQ60_3828 [Pseudomonadota bacterium]|jgi:cytochrome c6